MKSTLSKRALLETVLIRCARAAVTVSIEELLVQINALKQQFGGASAAPTGGGKPAAAPLAPAAGRAPAAAVAGSADGRRVQGTGGDGRGRRSAAGRGKQRGGEGRRGSFPDGAMEGVAGARRQDLDAGPRQSGGCLSIERGAAEGGLGLDQEFADELKGLELSRSRKAVEHVLSAMLKRTVSVELSWSKQRPRPISPAGRRRRRRRMRPPPHPRRSGRPGNGRTNRRSGRAGKRSTGRLWTFESK